jgi:hypothetical protein
MMSARTLQASSAGGEPDGGKAVAGKVLKAAVGFLAVEAVKEFP